MPLSDHQAASTAETLQFATPVPNMEWPIIRTIWAKRLMPMNPVECVILDSIDAPTKVLLTRREEDDPHFPRDWHHPGSYFGADERFDGAVRRVVKRDLGMDVCRYQFVTAANFYGLRRDHELCLIFVCELIGSPEVSEKVGWFSLGDPPEDFIPHHRLIHERVVEWLRFRQSLLPSCRNQFDTFTNPVESDTPI